MIDINAAIPPRLHEIIEDFRTLEREEKLESLLEYSEQLPPMPEQFRSGAPLEHVDECATPIAIATEIDNEQIHFYFDIPPESPTVRGFAAILSAGLEGATAQQVLDLPVDLHYAMGLQSALSPQRLNGMHFMVLHMKRAAARELQQGR